MFDIIKFSAEPSSFGFSKFFNYNEIVSKLVVVENLKVAAEYKNKKLLLCPKDFAFDEGAIKLIGEKKMACFLIDISRLVRSRGVSRAIAFSKLRTFLRLCVKHGTYYTFATFAENESQLRRPEEIENIALLLGLNRGQARFALKMIQHYV